MNGADVLTAPQLCVDVKRAAEMLSVSPSAIRAYIANGLLPAVKLPPVHGDNDVSRRVLIAVSDLQAFVTRHREGATR